MMSQSTRNKVALVTGAGSATGIGFAVAKKLVQNGFAVVITSTTDRIHKRAEELRRQGATALSLEFDLTSHGPPEFDAWRWGRLDETPELVIPFKRRTYEAVVSAFRDYAKLSGRAA